MKLEPAHVKQFRVAIRNKVALRAIENRLYTFGGNKLLDECGRPLQVSHGHKEKETEGKALEVWDFDAFVEELRKEEK